MWKSFYLEIAKVGLWNGLTFSKSILKKILVNFEDEGVIPVIPNHIPEEYKSAIVEAKITKMRLSKDGKTLEAEMQLKGWMLDKWENGEFLKPSIELQNHDQIGWNVTAVALLGELAPGIKGLKTEIAPFKDKKTYTINCSEKFIFCENFNESNENKNGGLEMTYEEIKTEVKKDLTLEFSDKLEALKTDLENSKKENESLKDEIKTFKEEKEKEEKEREERELKKYNDQVVAHADKMKDLGYKEEDIKKFSDKYTDKILFSDVLEDIKLVDQREDIREQTNFSEKTVDKKEIENKLINKFSGFRE